MTESESFSIYSSEDEGEGQNIYQPDAKLIANLYLEIKEKGALDLDWKFIGRLTPSEYDEENKTNNQEQNTEDKKEELKDNSSFMDFDFDEDLDTSVSKMNLNKKKTIQGPKQVNLDKVMSKMKTYKK